MPVNVFIAYVDTYIGKQLLRQFEASPHLFSVSGCTWTPEAAQELNENAARKLQQQHSLQFDGATVSSISPLSTARDHDSQATLPASSPSSQGAGKKSVPAVSPTGNEGCQALSDTGSIGVSQGTKAFTQPEAAETHSLPRSTQADPAGAAAAGTGRTQFFSRHDVSVVSAALASCEWIIVEQRQSQEVMDMLSCVQQGVFDRPKRFVLLSSFMTWYATPPLTQPDKSQENSDAEAEDVEAAVAAAAATYEGIPDGTGEDGEEGNDDDDDAKMDVNAPYPPMPEPTSDAEEAEAAANTAASDEDDDDNGDDAAANQQGNAEDAKEVLTEDQYNRRVPHVKYYNWRDAEKAVAAAHRAKGLPLDTYVIFAGLPYGEGEELLEPFFRQAWCGSGSGGDNRLSRGTLPIYGDGNQRVPLIHVRDLATFTRKLLHRPASVLPSRYIFATDGARSTWRNLMRAINKSFGEQCELVPVSPADYPLHRHVEQFTIDLCVERGTMAALMEEMALNPSEGDVAGGSPQDSLWVSEGGLRRHIDKVALNFCQERHVTPLRIVLQGPPLVGKHFVGSRLATFYRLPSFSIEDVVDAYKACLAAKKADMEEFQRQLLADELARRRGIRKRRILNAYRSGKRVTLPMASNTDPNADGDEAATADRTSAAATDARKSSHARRSVGPGSRNGTVTAAAAPHGSVSVEEPPAKPSAGALGTAGSMGPGEAEAADEPDPAVFELTEAEVAEASELVAERFDTSARVARWRREVGEMERVLLMRVRVPPAAAASSLPHGSSLGEDASGGPLKKRSVAAAKPKKLTKEQQRKKEEEELLQAKEALKDAPFQDRALALMLRWRLSHADCRTRGYVLHGFPQTVAQARLAFGSEPLSIPKTEEEALNPPPAAAPADGRRDDDDGEDGEADPLAGLTSEPSDEHRLPNVVLVFEAPENYLLDRLAALSELRQQQQQQLRRGECEEAAAGVPEGSEQALAVSPSAKPQTDFLRRFHDHLQTFKQEFMEAAYSMLSYWECAVTEPGKVTPGGRRAEVHLLAVHETEPLVPPTPPASAYELVPPCETELAARAVVGAPHFFGSTPLEDHQEAVRKMRLLQEQKAAEQRQLEQERQRDKAAYNTETHLREAVEERLLETKRADLAALEARKEPLRAYLMESVIPLVSKGLIEVVATRPENPLEYLAEWLLRHNPNNDVFMDL